MRQFRFAIFILMIAYSVTATSQSKFVVQESSSEFSNLNYVPESQVELSVVNFNDIKFNRFSSRYFVPNNDNLEQNEIFLVDAKSPSIISIDHLKALNSQFRRLEIPKACLIVYDRCKRK